MTTATRPVIQRKVTYLAILLALFIVNTFFWRGVASPLTGNEPPSWTVSAQAKRLELTDLAAGEADLTGSAIRMLLSGSRGLALATLWYQSDEMKKKNEWNKMELLVNAILKLQPHSPAPWTYQSWNIAYNVSVESDRVKDKYFYIAKGLQIMADGIRKNRDQPDMRYMLGFYFQNKFGVSDENNYLRSLLQLSCIDPSDRDAAKMRPRDQIDLGEFEKFARAHPMLVRRLKEKLDMDPDRIVDFLRDNHVIPSRFYDPATDGKSGRRPKDVAQFPTLPAEPSRTAPSDLTEESILGDDVWNFHVARSWFNYAQDPLPPPEPQTSLRERLDYARETHKRVPRAPALVIFRHLPARAQAFIAEYYEKEGWFDDSGWNVDQDRTGLNRWFPTDRQVAPFGTGVQWAENEWTRAYQLWLQHGQQNGLLYDPTQLARLEEQAKLYRDRYKVPNEDYGKDLVEGSVDAQMKASYLAHRTLFFYRSNQQMSNFTHHYFRAEAEKDRDAILARSLFYDAARLRKDAEAERAMTRYEQGFEQWKKILVKYPNLRDDYTLSTVLEDVYEYQIHYMDLVSLYRGPTIRPALIVGGLLGQTATGFVVTTPTATIWSLPPIPKPLELPIVGPLDQLDPKGEPWVSAAIADTCRSRLGRDESSAPRQPTPSPSPESPPASKPK
jgi:hypothetical protein